MERDSYLANYNAQTIKDLTTTNSAVYVNSKNIFISKKFPCRLEFPFFTLSKYVIQVSLLHLINTPTITYPFCQINHYHFFLS